MAFSSTTAKRNSLRMASLRDLPRPSRALMDSHLGFVCFLGSLAIKDSSRFAEDSAKSFEKSIRRNGRESEVNPQTLAPDVVIVRGTVSEYLVTE